MTTVKVNPSDKVSLDTFKENIGKKVKKTPYKEGLETRPFKSGFKTNTVKDVILHPILEIPAYTFYEDDSYVECRRCVVL